MIRRSPTPPSTPHWVSLTSHASTVPLFPIHAGEHSFKSLSLEDLIQSFDNTINTCFSEQQQQQLITREEEPLTPVSASKFVLDSLSCSLQSLSLSPCSTWTNLIDNLRTSLRHDLKLPHLADQCQSAMQKAHETNDALPSMDDVDESELREQFDMHSVLVSANSYALEPFLTAEQVISEIDFMLQDMTPDSGYCDDRSTTDLLDLHSRRVEYLLSTVNNDEFDLKAQSVYSLNEFVDELNRSIKDLSSILVQELAARDELEYDKETKNTFISLVHSIQVGVRVKSLDPPLRRVFFPPSDETSAASDRQTAEASFAPRHEHWRRARHGKYLSMHLPMIVNASPNRISP